MPSYHSPLAKSNTGSQENLGWLHVGAAHEGLTGWDVPGRPNTTCTSGVGLQGPTWELCKQPGLSKR